MCWNFQFVNIYIFGMVSDLRNCFSEACSVKRRSRKKCLIFYAWSGLLRSEDSVILCLRCFSFCRDPFKEKGERAKSLTYIYTEWCFNVEACGVVCQHNHSNQRNGVIEPNWQKAANWLLTKWEELNSGQIPQPVVREGFEPETCAWKFSGYPSY